MKPQDFDVWNRFIDKFPTAYEGVQYDLALGLKPPFDTIVVPETGGDQLKLYLRKIDVVGKIGDRLDIIEVKPIADFSTIGQVKGYLTLYKNLIDPAANARAVIVCGTAKPDAFLIAAQENVQLILV